MKPKILIPQQIAEEGKEFLISKGYEIVMGSGDEEKDLIHDVKNCEAIILRTAPCTKKVLEAGKKLKIVARHGAGYNNVDLVAAEQLGIWVTNTPDATTNSVAEFTLGMIIATAKHIFLASKAMLKGDFFFKENHKGVELSNKTLSIIGFGRIGRTVAQKAYYGLGMNILFYNHSIKEDVPEYAKQVDWDTAFSSADFVTIHVPLTKKTRGFITGQEFKLMKNSAYLINCSRGAVVNEEDLLQAIRNKEIAGAHLDVFAKEPPNLDNPLLNMNEVTVTPHMASNTVECTRLVAEQSASQVNLVLSGYQPIWPLNKPVFNDKK
jgi:D-3-phosphoglycerate dehydrogenase